jgi:DNA replication protein DnaC
MPKLPGIKADWLLEAEDSARLKDLNPGDPWGNPQTYCRTCMFHIKPDKSRTFRWWNEDRTEIVDWECDCTAQWVLHRRFQYHGIEMNYQRLGWADATDVPDVMREATYDYIEMAPWYVERGLSLVFYSPDAGTGKTMMLNFLGKELVDRKMDVFIAQMNKVWEMYTSGWRSIEAKNYFERRVMNCGVLGIDDWGKERGGDTRNELVDSLMDRMLRHRIAGSKPILATTNLTKDHLSMAYGRYVADLLTESTLFVESHGLTWRKKALVRTIEESSQNLGRPVVIR